MKAIVARTIARDAARLVRRPPRPAVDEARDLLRAVSFIDLAALADDETDDNVRAVCVRGLRGVRGVHVAAVCVRPQQVAIARETLRGGAVRLASVAGGFPHGRMPVAEKVAQIRAAVEAGAQEVDVVITHAHVRALRWRALKDEIAAFRGACPRVTLKVILATGVLGRLSNVDRASRIGMEAGADFIKTSTGRERVNATLSVGLVMARAIRAYASRHGRPVGLKPSGGIRSAGQALDWLALVRQELGEDWLAPSLFRIGASGLLADIERQLAG